MLLREVEYAKPGSVGEALELLEPLPEERDECRHDIEVALGRIKEAVRTARSFKLAGSKLGKRQLESYRTALNRLQTSYKKLDPSIRPWFSLTRAGFASEGERVIDHELTIVNAFLARPSQPSGGADASFKKAAVALAHDLLEFWRHDAGRTFPSLVSRPGLPE